MTPICLSESNPPALLLARGKPRERRRLIKHRGKSQERSPRIKRRGKSPEPSLQVRRLDMGEQQVVHRLVMAANPVTVKGSRRLLAMLAHPRQERVMGLGSLLATAVG